MGSVRRLYVEKKKGMNIEANGILQDLRTNLGIKNLEEVRLLNRYDIENLDDEDYEKAKTQVFSEPNLDNIYEEQFYIGENSYFFAVEYLPGQYDQRADSAMQCVQILTRKERPEIKAAKVYVLIGTLSKAEINDIKKYLINPIESREDTKPKPETLALELSPPSFIKSIEGFIGMYDSDIFSLREDMGLAMSKEDLLFCREYFKNSEHRDPTITEIRVIDTYWSDHCRHTTFLTKLNEVKIPDNSFIKSVYEDYLNTRKEVYGDRLSKKDICLMDIATIGMKYLRKQGYLNDLDESDEINACSIRVQVDIDGKEEEYLVMFKNETHNHPTEIEPFGGAATCLGGAIRDPLSGRSYVYQAMRVTGAADPTVPVINTREGKLPQRKITTGAAAGYSSYGNQIGLATGQVDEIYHPGYMAKRMEIGAVIASSPSENVLREHPAEGDVVILLGGRTGRDGIGGATGSSKEHTVDSVKTCGSEVQKGNPPTERKIQRLFRNKDVSRLIKKCNDFGAGGVCVAIGELAPSLTINLDEVPKKYEGLDGTELAISESQERMAVVVSASDADLFIDHASKENLEAVKVATITDNGRLKMLWRGREIVDIKREFLDTNGVTQYATAEIKELNIKQENKSVKDIREEWLNTLSSLNSCSKKGLAERFDSTVGANTVLMPFGGKYQLTPSEGMVAKIPILKGETSTGTIMTYGFDPYLSEQSPFHGSVYAIVDSLAKLTALGGDFEKARLTLQEYFEKLFDDPTRWGKPLSALLGAFYTQKILKVPAIGGKDSMSGTFMELDVPPTLVSFAVGILKDVSKVVSQEFKKAQSKVILYILPKSGDGLPDFENLKKNYRAIHSLMQKSKVLAASTVKSGGISETVSKMCFGNKIGFRFESNVPLFEKMYGSIVLELSDDCTESDLNDLEYVLLGKTTEERAVVVDNTVIDLDEMINVWSKPLNDIFPEKSKPISGDTNVNEYEHINKFYSGVKVARPRVLIPVFPGTNCEYETAKAFEKAGAIVETLVFRNLSASDIEESISEMKRLIDNSQIIMIPGGFSGGDEPDGSGKFIATAFRNPYIRESVSNLLSNRDGLMLGICNGFQALIKLGLVPYGEIKEISDNDPTLTFNTIGRHISRFVRTKIVSTKSPWLWNTKAGEIYSVPVSHGEGRFYANNETLDILKKNNQIATQYVDENGVATLDPEWNLNGSVCAIEGITSPDGRILGKMAHSERIGDNICVNIPGPYDQMIFRSGVEYFIK